MMRELKPAGRSTSCHNEVDSIERMRERLTRLLPKARISVRTPDARSASSSG